MLHLAGREEDWQAYKRLAPLVDGDTLDLIDRVALASAANDTAAIAPELAKVVEADPFEVLGAVADVATWTRDLATSDRLARRAIEAGRSPEIRQFAHLGLAHLDVLRGQWRAAQREIASIAAGDDGKPGLLRRAHRIASGLEASCVAAAFLGVPQADLRRVRDRIAGDTAAASGAASSRIARFRPVGRMYLLGILSARLGEPDSAVAIASRIERMSVPAGLDTVAMGMARGVRAQAAWSRGDRERALLLADSAVAVNVPADLLSIWDKRTENYIRAEALYQAGRYQEALPLWQNALDVGFFGSFVYGAIVQLRVGQIYDHMGDSQQAALHYARFVQLWKDADAPLQPLVREARQRLERIQSATG